MNKAPAESLCKGFIFKEIQTISHPDLILLIDSYCNT